MLKCWYFPSVLYFIDYLLQFIQAGRKENEKLWKYFTLYTLLKCVPPSQSCSSMRSFGHVVNGVYRHGVVTLWTHFRSSASYFSESVGDDQCICSFSLWLWVFPPDECVSVWGRKMNAEALFVMFCVFAEKISNNYICDEWKSLCLPTDFQMNAERNMPSCRFWLSWCWCWCWF